jgi:enolase
MDSKTNSILFEKLDIPVPELVYSYDKEKQKEIYEYLSTLDETQKKAYLIAKSHLGTSFNIYKSNGFKDWKKTK